MAFQQPTLYRPTQTARSIPRSTTQVQSSQIEKSQEWILFAPSQTESSSHATSQTVGLSRTSDIGSLQSGLRLGLESSVLDDVTEDDLDSLDDGLHAFREPPVYQNTSSAPVLPTHDGLGQFPSSAILEQLWQHEQHNPKRKHEGHHRRASSVQKKFGDIEAQASEEKRIRIEKWRIEQSQAFLDEVEKETRRQIKRESTRRKKMEDVLGSTPKQSDFVPDENVPFWRRITRKFIREVIGIDDPLLSVILGESLPGEDLLGDSTPRPGSPLNDIVEDESMLWRDKLLQRIAKELGVFVHQLTPHPGAFTTYEHSTPDYAGIPIRPQKSRQISSQSIPALASTLSSNFPPTLQDPSHAENWGFEDELSNNSLNLEKERQYWERELDVKMVFEFLKNRFVTKSEEPETRSNVNDSSATRVAIIRQHHPLVGRAHRSPVRIRKDSKLTRKPGSSCASESVKSGRKASRSSSRNYWDIGGSIGSGSLMASGGMMGAWGEV